MAMFLILLTSITPPNSLFNQIRAQRYYFLALERHVNQRIEGAVSDRRSFGIIRRAQTNVLVKGSPTQNIFYESRRKQLILSL
jgi:hypothetical protein